MRLFLRGFALFLLCAVVVTLLVPANAQIAEPYDPAKEGIASNYYPIDRENNFITGITPGTSAEKLLNTCAPGGLTLSSETVATGMTLSAEGVTPLTAVVTGDLNGDGGISISDMLLVKSALLGQELSAAAAVAGDMNFDGNVTITDFLKVKAYVLGIGGVEMPAPQSELLLLMPGDILAWPVEGAVAYRSGDQTLLTVDESGTVTVLEREGSAFVYALDEEGAVLDRQLITVLSQPLTVSLAREEAHLLMGQTMTLTATVSHPVSAQISWESSDETVVTVENGVLTAGQSGTAIVAAMLENGSRAEVTVTVVPPTEAIAIERKLHKIKPGATKSLVLHLTPADSEEEIIWTTSDPTIATVDENGVVTGHDYGTVTITATCKYTMLSAQCDVKVCDVIQVALTYDDGPSTHTKRLLDFLEENDIKVTFFVVGNRMTGYKDTLRREVEGGHEIGYHSFDHTIQTTLSSDKITSDFQWSDNRLYELTGAHFTLWRTPGGGYNARVTNAVPLPHILWRLDTLDWKTRNAEAVYRSIVNNARDGDIILVHDLHGTTVDGTIKAMKEMIAGDYEFLTVTELLSRDGTPPEKHKTYYMG